MQLAASEPPSPDGRRLVQAAVSGRTDAGRKRTDNQDNLLIADLSISADAGGYSLHAETAAAAPSARLTIGTHGAVLLVADGMGGAAAGATASALAVAHVYRELMDGWATGPAGEAAIFALRLRQTLEAANTHIRAAAQRDPGCYGMGTTATLAGVLADTVFLAQVGDSRAYLVRNGVAVQLTRDQSVVQELVDAGTMTEEEAERSVHSNRILQALGAAPQVDVVLTHQKLRRGDTLILCSDGLTRVVRRDEIAAAAMHGDDVAAVCQSLVDTANERGAPDNVTVVAARFDGPALEHAGPDDVVARTSFEIPAGS
jgi:PPM family protein phosphatase